MRALLVGLVSMLIGAGVLAQDAPAPVKQVVPLSEVVVLQCGKFFGAVIVLPDGTLRPTQDVEVAKAVWGTLSDGKAAAVEAGQYCGPDKTT
jgi:hypothetical protein